MKKTVGRMSICLAVLVVAGAGLRVTMLESNASATHLPARGIQVARPRIALASPGRVEGQSDTISVGAAIDGVVQAMHVHEGQAVQRGEVLADLGCTDLESGLQVANAEAESLRQTRARLLRGSREEERQAAAQKTAAARAVVEQASAQLQRIAKLWDAAAVSKASYDESKRDYEVADAQLKQAMRNEELTNAGPLPEEAARADADVRAAEDRVKLAQDKLSKCIVRAPISGTILRVNLREGESFALLAPRPLFTMADTSGRRVRAEVDERDVGKVRVGQSILVSSDAYGERHFSGNVVRLASVMGRKTVVTGDPADKGDRDILEAVAELEPGAVALPIGLRVTVQFIP